MPALTLEESSEIVATVDSALQRLAVADKTDDRFADDNAVADEDPGATLDKSEIINSATPSATTSVASTAPEALDSSIDSLDFDTLLEQAEHLFRADALTTPAGDNALDRWHRVLSVEQNNQVALEGIQRILDQYLEWGAQAERRGQFDKARQFYRRAEQTSPNSSEVAVRLQLLRDRRLSNN
jgi:tetratricopeptide (TPR) repeat protein